MKAKVLVIYTGGTIGMINHPETGELIPFDFDHIISHIPELNRLNCDLETFSFNPPLDSSNLGPEFWEELAGLITEKYDSFDGFVILHGSDTMAYSASALSFILENLNKPIIFTGSQLPIGTIRTDGKENIITSIQIAQEKRGSVALIPEVCIYFENNLFRANRTHKSSAENFEAFSSPNYPPLAKAGVHIKYNDEYIREVNKRKLILRKKLETNVVILKLFPGISENVVSAIINIPNLKGIVLESFGSGNAPSHPWFINQLKNAINKGITIVNVTQCETGFVDQGKYDTSIQLSKMGVISGADITTEAAVTKMMYLLSKDLTKEDLEYYLSISLRGEMST